MNLILLGAAIVISVLVFTWLVNIVKATVSTALIIAAIVFALHFILGIGPDKLLQEITQIIQFLWQLVLGKG